MRHNVEMIASEFFGGMSTHSRKVRIDCAASDPFTTHEVLAAIHGTPLRGKRVVVQRYGETNRGLQAALESKGADVIEIVIYRWSLPADTTPLLSLIDALGHDGDRSRGVHQRVAGEQPIYRRAIRWQTGVA